MSALSNILDAILVRTQNLIAICNELQQENDLLKLENQSLKEALKTSKNKMDKLEEKIRVLQLARSLEGLPSTELGINEKTLDIKQKITEFVREIDKCIVLLKK